LPDWNQLSVDGDTSTNDTVFPARVGRGRLRIGPAGTHEAAELGRAIEAVARIWRASRRPTARSNDAHHVPGLRGARRRRRASGRTAVVSSSLVKAAAHGRDPNWGRIAGLPAMPGWPIAKFSWPRHRSGCGRTRAGDPATLDPDRLRIAIAGQLVFDGAAAARSPSIVSRHGR